MSARNARAAERVFRPATAQREQQSSAPRTGASQDAGYGQLRPTRPAGVVPVGEMQESGFKEPQWLVRRDGRFIQLTELLYRIVEYSDGTRDLLDIARCVTDSTEWIVTPEILRQVIETKLLPLGLVVLDPHKPGPLPEPARRSVLSVAMRMKMVGPPVIDPITGVLRWLYLPYVLVPLLLAIAAAHAWLYLVHGVSASIRDALSTPGLLLLVLGVLLISILFHELGHASALRYGGGQVRAMGVGIYLVYPAFYTDTTDSYRLGRWGRVRTDLGGFYFHLIFALGAIGLAVLTGREFLLLVVLLINLDIVRQLLPLARFDGYWALVDLTGMPDFFSQIVPFLRSVLPVSRWKGPRLPGLKPWVKAVFAAYILVTIPALLLLLFLMVTRMPLVLGIFWYSMRHLMGVLDVAAGEHDAVLVSMAALQMLFLCIEMVGVTAILYMSLVRPILAAWNRVNPLPASRRTRAIAVALALVAGEVLARPQTVLMPASLLQQVSLPGIAVHLLAVHSERSSARLTRGAAAAHQAHAGGAPRRVNVSAHIAPVVLTRAVQIARAVPLHAAPAVGGETTGVMTAPLAPISRSRPSPTKHRICRPTKPASRRAVGTSHPPALSRGAAGASHLSALLR